MSRPRLCLALLVVYKVGQNCGTHPVNVSFCGSFAGWGWIVGLQNKPTAKEMSGGHCPKMARTRVKAGFLGHRSLLLFQKPSPTQARHAVVKRRSALALLTSSVNRPIRQLSQSLVTVATSTKTC